jgi:hypothetical protein
MVLSRLKNYFVSQYRRGLEVIDIGEMLKAYGSPLTIKERENCDLIDINEMLTAHEDFFGLEKLTAGVGR